jgi:hypothetical protein
MPLEEFLQAIQNMVVRPVFANAEEYDAFWENFEERTRPQLEAHEQAHRESEAIAFRKWRD